MTKFLNIIRAVIFYIWISITIVIGVIGTLLAWPLPFKSARFYVIRAWSKVMLWSSWLICGLRYKFEGLENIKNPPFIIFAKHQSAWETLVLSSIFPVNCFITKKELTYIPIFGWAFWAAMHIPIDRAKGLKALKKVNRYGQSRIKDGISIILFPEGTRVPPYENPPFHKGGAMLVKATKSPIVCVAHNAGHCWRRNSFIKTPGLITLRISEPMSTEGLSVNDINQMAYDWISKNMKELEKS